MRSAGGGFAPVRRVAISPSNMPPVLTSARPSRRLRRCGDVAPNSSSRLTPALFPVFRSTAQAEILAATLLHLDREQAVTSAAAQSVPADGWAGEQP